MPETDEPKLKLWLPKLIETIGQPDEELYLVGHSIGCAIGGSILLSSWPPFSMATEANGLTAAVVESVMCGTPYSSGRPLVSTRTAWAWSLNATAYASIWCLWPMIAATS